jgi:ferritin-like metal-binding protein YciE
MPKMTEPKELLTHELADLLYAERRFLTATRHMVKETRTPALKRRIEKHVTETERQIERLERAFGSIGEEAKGERCEAAIGLREEHDSFKTDEKPSQELLEAFDLGSGLRVEHYEIAAYRSAIAVAKALGEDECAKILKESLAEEEDMAQFLENSAPAALEALFGQG